MFRVAKKMWILTLNRTKSCKSCSLDVKISCKSILMQNFQTDSGKKVHLRFKIKSERFKEMSRERLDNNERR